MDGLHAYAFASVFVAHAADGELAENELLVIRRNVHRAGRNLGHPTQDIEEMIIQTVDGYWRRLQHEGPEVMLGIFQNAVATIRQAFSGHPETLAAIQRDLLEIAHADGQVDDMESVLIDTVGQLWDKRHA